MGSWIFALFCFMQAFSFIIAATEITQQDSCVQGIKTLTAKMDKLQADIRAIARGLGLLNPSGLSYTSCRDVYRNQKSRGNKAYTLQTDVGKVPVYCHMTSIEGCGGGGWTLVMKIDGHKATNTLKRIYLKPDQSTFHYDSDYWASKTEFNRRGGQTGFDFEETKLPTYWNTPFSKICVGMKIGHQIKFTRISVDANSLYSLIADGHYRATSLGRNTWKSLIGSQASLQTNCNKEGFNVRSEEPSHAKARIGILSNEQNDCVTCDSRIGFGTGGRYDDYNTCGNEATYSGDNGDKHIKAMGYILAQ